MHSYQGKSAIFNFNGGLKGGDLIIIDKKNKCTNQNRSR